MIFLCSFIYGDFFKKPFYYAQLMSAPIFFSNEMSSITSQTKLKGNLVTLYLKKRNNKFK